MPINKQELISKLKDQHRQLQSDLSSVLKKAQSTTDGLNMEIILDLTKFKKNLLEHMKVENESFYPDYLEINKTKGESVSDTKGFIRQMDDIERVVMAFLTKYQMLDSNSDSVEKFITELSSIIDTLNVRIETEEDGLFDLYLLSS